MAAAAAETRAMRWTKTVLATCPAPSPPKTVGTVTANHRRAAIRSATLRSTLPGAASIRAARGATCSAAKASASCHSRSWRAVR